MHSALLFVLFCFSVNVMALTPRQVPEPLKPWIDWVLDNEKDRDCPFSYARFSAKTCFWPGRLQLNLDDNGGEFSIHWTLHRDGWVELPGDEKNWPHQVKSQRKPLTVIKKQARPVVYLPKGDYQISGRFRWRTLPDNLAVPQQTALIDLMLNGEKRMDFRLKDGNIWLHKETSRQSVKVENRLQLQVFRKIIDGVPVQITTQLNLDVAGQAREVVLAHALLKGFIPVALNSPLPARLEPGGQLRIQVRPGQWRITITARLPENSLKLGLEFKDPDWPAEEIWSFQADHALRMVEISQVAAIDPSQTSLPRQWRQLPAYRLKQGDQMALKVLRRGDPDPAPDQLRLKRSFWLDFNGRGYTVQDVISGRLRRSWRLSALDETRLGQVKVHGKTQLITRLKDNDPPGVEVRQGNIQLIADSRIEQSISDLSVSGWRQDFQQVEAELNIPPGWRLLYVEGVDNDPDSWVSRWTLLDLFMVLVAALAVNRLWNPSFAIVALLTLALTWHEPAAPHFIWLNLLAVIALLRVLPQSQFSTVLRYYRNACWLAMMLIVLPFMVNQIRTALYPQLEKPWQVVTPTVLSEASYVDDAETLMEAATSSAPRLMGKKTRQSKSYQTEYDAYMPLLNQTDPNANLQTGPGLPEWRWNRTRLSWNGSIDSQQRFVVWYLSPVWMVVIKISQIVLIMMLSLIMLGVIQKPGKWSFKNLHWLMLLPLLIGGSQDSLADLPDQKQLDELKSRLLTPPQCLPDCAAIAGMRIKIEPDRLTIELNVHAAQQTVIPLPAQAGQWLPNDVKVDGESSQTLIRDKQGVIWASLPAGIHQLTLAGKTPGRDKFSLPSLLAPHFVQLKATGWRVAGVTETGQLKPPLQFIRLQRRKKSAKNTFQTTQLPAFIRIERTLQLGLKWTIHSRVVRLNNSREPVVLHYPLLPGESVTTAGIPEKDRQAVLSLAADQKALAWRSVLEKQTAIRFKAASTDQWVELWRARISPVWHVKLAGIAVIHHQNPQGEWLPEWRPWPGESVVLTISKPQAVSGSTLTVDHSEIRIKPGQRKQQVELMLRLHSSKAQQHTITLPDTATFQSLLIDGRSTPIKPLGRQLTLPVHPGDQELKLKWVEQRALGFWLETPAVDLGLASVNHHINVQLGDDRWLLLTMGPDFGPATLIWGLLIVLLLVALGLARTGLTPIKSWQWFLLLIGLSQIPLAASAVVIAWLLGLGLRARQNRLAQSYFNVQQVLLALLTVLALATLFFAVQQGLLGNPDMQIMGNQSSSTDLKWYQDRNQQILPTATVISAPLLVYRVLMLLWSLWLAFALLNWLQWGWQCFSKQGLWKKAEPKNKKSLVIKPETTE